MIENKTIYSNLIVANPFTRKMLFLKRAGIDDFEPNKWAFPGGKVEANENPDIAALRECKEEAGLNFAGTIPSNVHMHQNKDCVCFYYLVYCDGDDMNEYGIVTIDQREHSNYCWKTKFEAQTELDLILDLGDQLNKIFPS